MFPPLRTLFCCHLAVVSCSSQLVASDDTDDVVYTRFDRDAYLAARRGSTVGLFEGGAEGQSNYVDVGAKRRLRGIDNGGGERHSYDDPNQCTTYLAPSSIPDSGLGMYTTVPYQKGETFPFPEIGLLVQERLRHYTGTEKKLFSAYPWAAQQLTFGNHEVGYGESLIPGLGMLANSHLGLKNFCHAPEYWRWKPWKDGTDSFVHPETLTRNDAGRGAYSWHGDAITEASDVVQAGEELFVSYGDDWFTAREGMLGVVPGSQHYEEADKILSSFLQGEGGDDAHRSAKYEELLKNALEEDKRLRAALPNNLEDVHTAAQLGTARYSAKDSIRTTEWLEENGFCIDGIVAGESTIPQAGKGAFAIRSIAAEERITTTPVITMEREELYLFDRLQRTEEGGGVAELVGHQLLLNYCYGHSNSTLLFFPYSPSVNFVNHGGFEDANAKIVWSTAPYHKAEWLKMSLDEMKKNLKAGLMFDIIATRDIVRGEEVLLDYGSEWQEKWEQHVQEWTSMAEADVSDDEPYANLTERLGLPSLLELNDVDRNPLVKTTQEQAEEPYPSHVMTRCYFDAPEKCTPPTSTISPEIVYDCQTRWMMTFDPLLLHPCTILSRPTTSWYTAEIEVFVKDSNAVRRYLVEYVPRYAIRFVDRPYSKDQYVRGAFRQNIGLPEGIMPQQWLDLNEDDEHTWTLEETAS